MSFKNALLAITLVLTGAQAQAAKLTDVNKLWNTDLEVLANSYNELSQVLPIEEGVDVKVFVDKIAYKLSNPDEKITATIKQVIYRKISQDDSVGDLDVTLVSKKDIKAVSQAINLALNSLSLVDNPETQINSFAEELTELLAANDFLQLLTSSSYNSFSSMHALYVVDPRSGAILVLGSEYIE